VSAGPISPVSRPGHKNSRPVPGDRVEAVRDGKLVSVTYTDKSGRYRFSLPPGTYVIEAGSAGYRHMPKPETVTVRAGRVHIVDFMLETGIR